MKIFCLILALTLVFISFVRSGADKNAVVIDDKCTVIDVRTEEEFRGGHLESAINIPYRQIADKIKNHVQSKDEKIVLYCHSGMRSRVALGTLKKLGYKNAVNGGAYGALKERETKKIR